jgi:hypothetical protein
VIRILATGVFVDEHADPEPELLEAARAFGEHLSPEDRAELARWRAGELVYVRITSFVEFDDGSGVQRWDETPQGPYPLPLGESATSALLNSIEDSDQRDNHLADFGINEIPVSRFEFEAAPRRIDVDPPLAARLTLD